MENAALIVDRGSVTLLVNTTSVAPFYDLQTMTNDKTIQTFCGHNMMCNLCKPVHVVLQCVW